MFNSLGRATYEQDAYSIRPLVIERSRLTRAAAATDTTIYINSLPRGVGAYSGWVVIDPFTSECEIRRITARTGKILTLSAALAYAHSRYDDVTFVDSPMVNSVWLGAVGDGTTEDYVALSRSFAQAGTISGWVYTPASTYAIGTGLAWVDHMIAWVGDRHTIIKATGAITMLTMNPAQTEYHNRYLEVRNLILEGDDQATKGLLVDTVVECNFKNITIEDVNGAGMILDNTQNSNFDRVFSNNNNIGFQISNGAASNGFFGCHTNQSTNYGLKFVEDATLPDYGTAASPALQNAFYKCIFERGSAGNMQLYIKYGKRNMFSECSFIKPDNGTVALAYIHATEASQNIFDHCRFNNNSSTVSPVIENHANMTRLEQCTLSGWSGAFNVIDTDDLIYLHRCTAENASGSINVTGTIANCVIFEADRQAGATSDRPTFGDAYNTDYYDTDEQKPMWYNPVSSAWHDALNGKLTLGARTALVIAGGTITVSNNSNYSVDTTGGTAGTADLNTISGGVAGQIIVLRAESNLRTVVCKDATGNLQLAGDFNLDHSHDRIVLQYDGTNWCEWTRSDNTA